MKHLIQISEAEFDTIIKREKSFIITGSAREIQRGDILTLKRGMTNKTCSTAVIYVSSKGLSNMSVVEISSPFEGKREGSSE